MVRSHKRLTFGDAEQACRLGGQVVSGGMKGRGGSPKDASHRCSLRSWPVRLRSGLHWDHRLDEGGSILSGVVGEGAGDDTLVPLEGP